MSYPDSRRVLWANVSALMAKHWGGENLTRLAREAKIGPGSCSRMKTQETSIGLELIDKVAGVFNVPTWALFVPEFDPDLPPTLVPGDRAQRAAVAQFIEAAKRYTSSS